MLNKVYQLIKPQQFEPIFKEIDLDKGHVLVRPTRLSICHADQRYYQGTRPDKVLKEKLPMALIHEAAGMVIADPSGRFREGEQVVLIPNTPVEKDAVIAENYLPSSFFRASGFDGFMQEYVLMDPDRVLLLPEHIHPSVAAFTEIVSVSFHAISRFLRFSHERRRTIGLWGDGNLGYITALLLRYMFPEIELIIFGVDEYKLHDFTFADQTYQVTDIPAWVEVDHAFECVGNTASGNALAQIIDHIRPEGTISLLGVSENPVPVYTRMVLEKGLHLFGSSRSGREDFINLLKLYKEQPRLHQRLEKLIGAEVTIRTVQDISTAFEMDLHKNSGKTVMLWNI